jgi:septal ring factor EnvC (AmiA/AmiB activator)
MVQEEWAGKVVAAEAAAARQVAAIQATVAARDSSISELQADVQARDEGIAQLHELVASLEAGKAELARQLAVATAQLEAAGRLRLQLERGFAEERELVAALQTQVSRLAGGSELGAAIRMLPSFDCFFQGW